MPNGKKHDHPFTDTLDWGLHPFPEDIEKLIVEINRLDSEALWGFAGDAFAWERGEHLGDARKRLRRKLDELQQGPEQE